MTDDKSRKDQGAGFFDDDDEFLEEHTVVDTEVLKKLNEKIQTEEEDADVIVEPELLEEIEVKPEEAKQTEYKMPPKASDPPVPPVSDGQPLVSSGELSGSEKEKLNKVHQMFEEPENTASSIIVEEKTVILPDEEISGMSGKASAKLIVTEGESKDKEYKIEYNEIYVGRGVENDFVVTDKAISRKHFRIRRRLDEYIIVDLQSGNGTRINGEKIDEVVLKNGDQIKAGKTAFEFVDEAELDKAAAVTDQSAPAAEVIMPKATTEPEPVAPEPVQPEPEKVIVKAEPKAEVKPETVKEAPAKRLEPLSAHRAAYEDIEKPAGGGGLVVGIIGVVIVVAALILFQQYQNDASNSTVAKAPVEKVKVVEKTPEPAATPVAKVDPQKQTEEKIKGLLEQGKVLVGNKSFSKAVDNYNEVLALDSGNAEAKMAKASALKEVANKKSYEEGSKFANQNNADSALIRLSAVGKESVYFAEAQALIKKVEDTRYTADVEKGKTLLDGKKYDKAIGVFASVLKKQPTNVEASRYKDIAVKEKQAAALQNEQERKAAAAKLAAEKKELARKKEAERKAAAAKLAAEKKREAAKRKKLEAERKRKDKLEKARKAKEKKQKLEAERKRKAEAERQRRLAEEAKKRKVTSTKDLNKGYSLYKDGSLDKSIAEFNTIVNGRGNKTVMKKAKGIVGKIKKFKTVYNKGVKAHKAKNIKTAVTSLKDAMRQDRTIVKGSSFSKSIPKLIADMYYEIGKGALKKDQYDKASKGFAKALKFYPNHAPSKKGMKDLGQKAQKLYYQGYAIKDSDPDEAENLWNTVLKIAPKSSQWYKKAESGLEDL